MKNSRSQVLPVIVVAILCGMVAVVTGEDQPAGGSLSAAGSTVPVSHGLDPYGGYANNMYNYMDNYQLYNSLHSVNAADMIDLTTKLSKKPLRRRAKSAVYGAQAIPVPVPIPSIPDYNILQPQYMQLKPRTEDIWAIDGKAKHLEVLLLFVILAGLLLKVAFSLMWWKQALGGMGIPAMGWHPPPQSNYGGYGGGGGGGGGYGWGGWRQLDDKSANDSSNSILNQVTDFVEKAIHMKFPKEVAGSKSGKHGKAD